MSWDAELQWKSREILEGLDKYVAYHHFKLFENVHWNFDLPTPNLGGHGIHKKFEDLCCAELVELVELVNYILEPIKKMN
jgi:hypothetical protein